MDNIDWNKATISRLEKLVSALEDQDSLVERLIDKIPNALASDLYFIQSEILNLIRTVEDTIQGNKITC